MQSIQSRSELEVETSLATEALKAVARAVDDKKGRRFLAIDVRGYSSLTDYTVIAEGNVNRHVQAIAKAVIEELSKLSVFPSHIEGMSEGQWVVIDFGDLVVHIFDPEQREKYRIEGMWPGGKFIPVELE